MVKRAPLFVALLSLCGCGAARAERAPTILPLTTLRLYETGVGYFERSGTVDASAATSLPVPQGHLDDALKTLVVLSGDGKSSVHGLEFGSSVSRGMARAMAGLPTDADAPITYRDLILSMKGQRVEVKTAAGTWTGRLIDVTDAADAAPSPESTPPAPAQGGGQGDAAKRAPRLTLILLTDASAIVRFRTIDTLSVRPTDPAYASRLDAALDVLSSRNAQSEQLLNLVAEQHGNVTL